MYESTPHPLRQKPHLGKRGTAVDSCTTTRPRRRRGRVLVLAELRIADNQPHLDPLLVDTGECPGWCRPRIADNTTRPNNGCPPTNSLSRPHSALRTTTAAPTIGAHPRNPGAKSVRRGATRQQGPHRGRGGSTRSHADPSCGAEVEYRTSSTPAYTDGLDLRYSTNNAATKPPVPVQTPHCGQQEPAPSLVRTHELQIGPDSALRTTPPPTMGPHPRIARIDVVVAFYPGKFAVGRRAVFCRIVHKSGKKRVGWSW